jgi:hypothetical protein
MNYYINETVFPNMTMSTYLNAAHLCNNVSQLPNASQYNFTCETWNSLFACMATPVHWKIANGGVYLPYAWLDENTVMPKRYADDIQKGVLDNLVLAQNIQTWGLVTGGI